VHINDFNYWNAYAHIPGCHHDFLEIRDGYWHKSELLGNNFETRRVGLTICLPTPSLTTPSLPCF